MSFNIDDFDRESIDRGIKERKEEKKTAEWQMICIFCQWEFKQNAKSTSAICKKCAKNVQIHGNKPEKCRYCFMISAFSNGTCQRCHDSYKQYGFSIRKYVKFLTTFLL